MLIQKRYCTGGYLRKLFLRFYEVIVLVRLPESLFRSVRVLSRQCPEQSSTEASKLACANTDAPAWNRAKSRKPARYQLWIARVSIFSAQPEALYRFPATP